ncbi:MAG TPA: DUF5110 domain-containing protein, partial [Polyangia bacterium]|nr:DUF5110 domain-containing protein [Polyangia bacterium]
VLVRGGAIIPHQPLVQSTSETPKGPLELRVYPGADCRGSLYLDDGASFKYQKGEYLRLGFSCQQDGEAGKSISVKTSAAEGSYTPWFQSLAIVVHGAPSAPRQVTAGGEPSRNFRYDKAKKTVTVTVPYAKGGQVVTVGY